MDPTFNNPNDPHATHSEPVDAADSGLERSELRYRRLFEAARDGVLIINPETRKIIGANPFMTDLLGYPLKDLLGRELFEIGPMKNEAASRAAFAELQEKGYIRFEHLPLETKWGSRCEVEFVCNLYREGSRDVVQCNIRDITVRKRTERENLEKARLLDLSNDAIIVCDLDNRIRQWNEGAAKLYGWTQAEVVGKNLETLLQSEWAPAQGGAARAPQPEGRFSSEVIQIARDGRRVPVLARGVRDRETLCVLASHTDITASKAAELEVAQARDQAIAASQAKDNFFAALSHELRTPLSPVLLLASDAVADAAIPAPLRESFAIIHRNVTLEARLIDDLLDVTRITHAKMVLDRTSVDVHLVLHDAIATVRPELAARQIELKLRLVKGNPVVWGDAVRLQQIFWNVLRNAEKFTPEGGAITVTTRLLSSERLVVEIADTGMGMTKPELERIFVSFSQGDHAMSGGSPRFGGLGLGLSIARRLTELHGGTIRAESGGLNQGSTFTIELPRASYIGSEPRPAAPAPAAPALFEPISCGPARRILLVEDHDSTRKALTQLLIRRHFEVVSASNIAEAQVAVGRGAFDVLISDLGLPDGSGLDLMRDLRARFGLKGIALSGFGEVEDIARSQAAGFSTHVTKPPSIQSLERALAMVAATSDESIVQRKPA